MAKRNAPKIVEDNYSESSDLEISEKVEQPTYVESEDESEVIEESNLVPLKKKKAIPTNSSNKMLTTTASLKRAEQQISSYKKKSTQFAHGNKGNKVIMISHKAIEFDIDELDLDDLQDSARQIITKKSNFPTNMIGVVTKRE